MKKVYSAPGSVLVNMEAEQMIAASLSINNGQHADQMSIEQTGWDCSDWSGAGEEE